MGGSGQPGSRRASQQVDNPKGSKQPAGKAGAKARPRPTVDNMKSKEDVKGSKQGIKGSKQGADVGGSKRGAGAKKKAGAHASKQAGSKRGEFQTRDTAMSTDDLEDERGGQNRDTT